MFVCLTSLPWRRTRWCRPNLRMIWSGWQLTLPSRTLLSSATRLGTCVETCLSSGFVPPTQPVSNQICHARMCNYKSKYSESEALDFQGYLFFTIKQKGSGSKWLNNFHLTSQLFKLKKEKQAEEKSKSPFEVFQLPGVQFLACWEVKSSQNTILFDFIWGLQNAAVRETAVRSGAEPH